MQIIALDKRKTSAKFYGDTSINPSKIYINSNFNQRSYPEYVELTERYVYRIKLKFDSSYNYKGLDIYYNDYDNHLFENISINESVIAKIMEYIYSGDIIIEDGCPIVNFTLGKIGSRYLMEPLTREEVSTLIRES